MASPALSFLMRLLRRLALAVVGGALLLAAALAYVVFVGITLDAGWLRTPVAGVFSENLGREVRFEGAMELELSAQPKLRVSGFQIANAPGFDGEFASLGEARLNLDLWPLLQNRLQIERLSGSDVRIRLQRTANGAANWRFSRSAAAPAAAAPETQSVDAGAVLARLDIQQVALERVSVEYIGADGVSHWFELRALQADAPAGRPMTALMEGTVEKQFPYRVEFTGGELAALADPARPWPVDLTLTFLSSTLTLSGTVSGERGEIRFGLGTETLSEFERLFQTELPRVGATGLAGLVSYQPGLVKVAQIAGVMGLSTMLGELQFDYSGARPRVSGHLDLPTLDLRPFLTRKPPRTQPEAPPPDMAALYRDLAAASFNLQELAAMDADVTLGVQQWLSLPGDVRDARLHLSLEAGRLEAPVEVSVTGVTLAGRVLADATQSPPRFELGLRTRDSRLGGLAELLTGAPGIDGHVGRLDLDLAATGDRVSDLVRSLDLRLLLRQGRLSYGNLEGGRPVEFTLDQLEIALPAGKAMHGALRGSLLGVPLQASVQGGPLEQTMLKAQTPIDFEARSGNVRARLRGLLQPPTESQGPDLSFEVSASRAGDIARWFGLRPGADAPLAMSGRLAIETDTWRLADFRFRLGRSRLAAQVSRTGIDSQPLITGQLSADTIDLAQLEAMLPKPQSKPAAEAPGRPVLDIPILPKGIDLGDADVEVGVARFEGSPLAVRDVSFQGRIREGYMHPSQFRADVADIALSGAVLLDLRGQEPRAALWLFARQADVGALLRRLGLARELDAGIDQLALYLDARASRLGDMLARSLLTATLSGGRVTLRDRNLGGEARVAVSTGELNAQPGQPVKLSIEGTLDDIPVRIGMEAAPATQLVDATQSLPFRLSVSAVQTDVVLSGRLDRPLGQHIELSLDARGARFDHLNRLLRTELPPWGAWSAAGRLRISPQGYAVDGLRLQVGESVLNGEGSLLTDRPRPLLTVSLHSPVIQLDDFRLGDWSPVEKKPPAATAPLSPDDLRRKAAEASDRAQKLLSPEVLKRQDVALKVRVDQVRSGADRLGSGSLDARLIDGRAEIGPVQVSIPGGSATFSLGYQPSDQDVKVDLRIAVDRFDYGILARRIKPDTDLRGSFSLDVDVSSRARYLSDILKHGSGRIEFAVWPVNMKAGVFDLWAVNLLVALVPAVDPEKQSKVNCAVGRFVLNDGVLVERRLVLDTTRMRVVGEGRVEFDDERLRLRMKPRAKTAQFLSLATPIEVVGPFDSFRIRVSPGDVVETVTRLATSVVWVPLQKLFGKRIPKDGGDVCAAPLAAE